MKRRTFIRNTTAGVVIPSVLGSFGLKALSGSPLVSALGMAGATDNVLVLINLSGGNDGLNTVVPLNFLSELNAVRPHVVLPENSLLRLNNSEVGLHPALTGFKDLYDEGRLQIIQNVGYPNQDFSHFRSTDIWMSGSDADQVLNTGWVGRYANFEYPNYPYDYPNETMPDPLALEIGYSSSLLFQGPGSSMGMVIQDPDDFYKLIDEIESPAPGTNAGEQLEYVRLIKRQSNQYGVVLKEASEKATNIVEYNEDNPLAQMLKIVARLIKGGLKTKLYLVEHGGFDTHDSQVDTTDHTKGEHATLLAQLSEAVHSFMMDLDAMNISDRVTGATISEFGRRIISNASYGTDHGAAAPLFLFGNHVNGGVHGDNPFIPSDATYDDNLEWKVDFRAVYASLFSQWLCVDDSDLNNIFFRQYDPISIIPSDQCSISSSREDNQRAGKSVLQLFPNRSIDLIHVEFESDGDVALLSLNDLAGKQIRQITQAKYPKGKHRISINITDLPAGVYFVILRQRRIRQAKQFIKM